MIAATRAALADGSARKRRIATGIRLREFADLLDVSTATISQWERLDADGKPMRTPGAKNALAYGRELAALERQQKAA